MKKGSFISIVLIALIVGGCGYYWYTQKHGSKQIRRICVEQIDEKVRGTNMGVVNAKGYCACQANINYEEKINKGENNANLVNQMRPCVNQFVRQPLLQVCRDSSDDMMDLGYGLDCECFVGDMMYMFVERQNISEQNIIQNRIVQKEDFGTQRIGKNLAKKNDNEKKNFEQNVSQKEIEKVFKKCARRL